jgi:hypothetical protein
VPAARHDRPGSGHGPAPATGRRYGWLIGVVALLAIAYITINTIRTRGPGSRGPAAGKRLPAFAAPLALGDVDKDADVATRPGQGASGSRPACEVRGPGVFNVCDLARGAPLVLAFFVTRGGARCRRELDLMQALRPRFAGVRFAAVSIRGDRGRLRHLVRTHGWSFPVGYDRDGAVANLYGVAVCPTLTFAYPGGVTMATSLGFLDEGRLATSVRRLVTGARGRGWRPPR